MEDLTQLAQQGTDPRAETDYMQFRAKVQGFAGAEAQPNVYKAREKSIRLAGWAGSQCEPMVEFNQ